MLPGGRFEPFPSTGPQQGLRNIVGVAARAGPGDPDRRPLRHRVAPEGVRRRQRQRRRHRRGDRARPHALRRAPRNHREIRFVLFDGEEDPPGCTDRDFQFCALRGSRAYAAAHPGEIGDMILLDYIANRGARIPREVNSNQALWAQLRDAA